MTRLPTPFEGFRCTSCGAEFQLGPLDLTCPNCTGGNVEAIYDYSKVSLELLRRGPPKVWKYRQLLPLAAPDVTMQEGGTPLIRCQKIPGFTHVYLKDESRNPTSSFADRGSTVAVSAALRTGAKRVACATDGDTGASLAAYSSKAGLDCMVFAPYQAEAGKLLQTLVYGAKVFRTRGSFRNSLKRCQAACEAVGCYNVTIETNPYALEGEKTTGFEIADQLGWVAPDFVVVPTGTGTNIYSTWKGYEEFHKVGAIPSVPKMVAVQDSACAPIVQAFRNGHEVRSIVRSNSLAISIAIGDPINGEAALTALRQSKGVAYSVDEKDMLGSVNLLGSREGIFAEPASAATICAARNLINDGVADASDIIVCVVTGSGLKVPDSIAQTLKPRLSSSWGLVSMDEKALGPLGKTKLQLLEILGISPNYGYSMRKQLDVRFGEKVTLQAVYQHLDELRGMELVTIEEAGSSRSRGRRRKYFALTSRGRRILRSLDSIRDSLLVPGNDRT